MPRYCLKVSRSFISSYSRWKDIICFFTFKQHVSEWIHSKVVITHMKAWEAYNCKTHHLYLFFFSRFFCVSTCFRAVVLKLTGTGWALVMVLDPNTTEKQQEGQEGQDLYSFIHPSHTCSRWTSGSATWKTIYTQVNTYGQFTVTSSP